MSGRPYILAETNWRTVEHTPYEVANSPVGGYGSAQLPPALFDRCGAVRRDRRGRGPHRLGAGRQGHRLADCAFGVNTGQLDIKLDLNLNPSTQFAVLQDLVEALAHQGHSQTAHCERSRRQ